MSTSPTALAVRVDDGLRLAGALLAAGEWPEREQALRPYKPHRVAEAARRALAGLRDHPAVAAAQRLAGAPGQAEVEQFLAFAFAGDWPPSLLPHLSSFIQAADLDQLHARAHPDWEQAEAELRAVLAPAGLARFLDYLLGPGIPPIVVHPNLLYPGHQPVALVAAHAALLCQPPPPAWGASPPWRYVERPDEVLAAAAQVLARAVVRRARPGAAAEVVGLAAAVLFLRAAEGAQAADQFLLMERRARNLPRLPDVVAALAGCQGLSAALAALAQAGFVLD
jgi:hypothetical protein